jgi:hypothetical protein
MNHKFEKKWKNEFRKNNKKVLLWERPFLPAPPRNLTEDAVVGYMKKTAPYLSRAKLFPLSQINELVRYVLLFLLHSLRLCVWLPYIFCHSVFELATMNNKMLFSCLCVGSLVPWVTWLFVNIPVNIWLKQNVWTAHMFQKIDVSDQGSGFLLATIVLYGLYLILFVGVAKGGEYCHEKIKSMVDWL